MRLKRFTATGLHGFLRFDIRFDDNLTFLTGINGSGKTTALYAIVALITPDLTVLSNLEYERISVILEHDGTDVTISADSDEFTVALSASSTKESLAFSKYIIDPDLPIGRQNEAEFEHFRDLLATRSDHPVIKLIASLPTPMFLGLDRRARFDEDLRRSRFVSRQARTSRNIFGSSLSRSLADASELAETKYRDALIASGQVAEKLQREMLLNLITVNPDERSDGRRRIYIIDGDFDFLLGRRRPGLRWLYRLRAYCIENLLLRPRSLVELSIDACGVSDANAIALRLNLNGLVQNHEPLLRKLFYTYAAAYKVAPPIQTVGYSVMRLTSTTGGAISLEPVKIRERIAGVIRAVRASVPANVFRKVLRQCQERGSNLSLDFVISGKDYLLPLIWLHTRREFSYKGSQEQFKIQLAKEFSAQSEPYLARAIARAAA